MVVCELLLATVHFVALGRYEHWLRVFGQRKLANRLLTRGWTADCAGGRTGIHS
jgi:hypothetical protein